MDAGVAAIIAASISTVFGGVLGFLSAYLTTRQLQNHAFKISSLPKQMDAAEYIAKTLFKGLSKAHIDNNEWDEYISKCYWLPPNIRDKCLSILLDKDNRQSYIAAQQEIIRFFDTIIKGE
jgi:hypothetical protein